MTQANKETAAGIFDRTKEFLAIVAELIAIAGGCWLAVLWLTGGLRPQTQVDQDTFRAQLTSIQATQDKNMLAIQSAQDRNAAANTLANDRILSRLDALPKPSDLESHLSRIDQALLTAYDRASRMENEASNLRGRIEGLISGDADRANKPQLGRAAR